MLTIATFREFLESKFGFWLATTVLVALATTANAFLQSYFAEKQRRQSVAERVDLEVEYRLSQYMAGLAHMTKKERESRTLRQGYTPQDVKVLTYALVGIPKQHKDVLFFSMYPRDFGDRPLASLLAEKASLHPEYAGVLKNQIALVTGYGLLEERDFSDVFALASEVNRVLFPRNATGEFFFYTDCKAKSPWC